MKFITAPTARIRKIQYKDRNSETCVLGRGGGLLTRATRCPVSEVSLYSFTKNANFFPTSVSG
jgi:hypothetical protein